MTNGENINQPGCKKAAGDEVIVYGFVLSGTGWKFKSLDNINE